MDWFKENNMIDKKDINALLFVVLWLVITIFSALDGLTLFISIWTGVGLVLYKETTKQYHSYGISWEVIVLFIGSVLAFSTAGVYLLVALDFINRLDVGPIYLAKLTPGYAGLLIYVGFQANLLRQQHQQIQKGIKHINGERNGANHGAKS